MRFEPGPVLDRLIELRVFGRKPVGDVPPYSTNDASADVVVRALARPPLRWMCAQTGREWTFRWRRPMTEPDVDASTVTRYVNMVTVTAPTRALAICQAALKLVGPIGEGPEGERDRMLPDPTGRSPGPPENLR